MIEKPMDVLAQFPVRKTKKQKQAFRDEIQSYVHKLGYAVSVEKGSGAQNVVIGNPETAKYLLTAHYDTPAGMMLPNLITPCNPFTFILYQLFIVGIFIVVSIAAGVLVGLAFDSVDLAGSSAGIVYWAMLILILLGPANKNNANDNTSGVVTVLEIARFLPENLRDRVCFVLLDLEEAGLVGSAAYRKKHKKETNQQIILNCDCVGDGDELMMFPTRKVRKDDARMEWLRSVCGMAGDKSLELRERGFAYYPSDQKNFPYGVGIAAFQRSSWAGLFCDKIHTKKDTVLDEKNVIFLRDKLIRLISYGAVQVRKEMNYETV